ncbi:hypothetical protein AURDEDRAFT_163039 [Auricularia subglabra TFB-10046 SS5]|nr:hypothetical protein AURDEDRAFT_163039 [Auricularia subglabra TFB-10046 SS5]
MTASSSSSASGGFNSSTWTSDTDGTFILEGHNVKEVPIEIFCKFLLDFDVTDVCGQPFELNQRAFVAILALRKANDLNASMCNVLNRITNLYNSATPIKFVDHSHSALLHHPEKSTTAQPLLIAVPNCIATSWSRDVKARSKRRSDLAGQAAIAWHHVLATVLIADERQPIDQMVEFLGALNQARPDLPGCFSLTATRHACRLWWGDAAGVYISPSLHWNHPATATHLLKFVHRLSCPVATDPTMCLEAMNQSPATYGRRPTWLVCDRVGGVYRAEQVIAVGRPWTRKNWTVSATEYRRPGSDSFAPCSRVVIKDSFPLVDNEGLTEHAILEHLHSVGPVAGVSLPMSSFLVTDGVAYVRNLDIPGYTVDNRRKHRMVLSGHGQDLYQCPSVLHFLTAMYDALEVHRFAHEQHNVLHREVSLRNILYDESSSSKAPPGSKFASEILAHKYPASRLLQGPACVLIDFDNAIWEGHSPEAPQRQSVGTPAFIARAVSESFSQEISVLPRRPPVLDGNARECYLYAFGPERYEAGSALFKSSKVVDGPASPERAVHSPHHDAESFFWVIFHFLLTALPRGASKDDEQDTKRANELVQLLEFNKIGGEIDLRGLILHRSAATWASVLHPGLRSLGTFIYALTSAVEPYFELVEPAPPPYHLHVTMQRILLREMCRLLDTDVLPLDTRERRAIPSRYNSLLCGQTPAGGRLAEERFGGP